MVTARLRVEHFQQFEELPPRWTVPVDVAITMSRMLESFGSTRLGTRRFEGSGFVVRDRSLLDDSCPMAPKRSCSHAIVFPVVLLTSVSSIVGMLRIEIQPESVPKDHCQISDGLTG